ncbi:MAG: hypothetical protein COA99_15960, partial [Moraxellaceae bacterium]
TTVEQADVVTQLMPWAAHLGEDCKEELLKIMEHSLYNHNEHIIDQGKPLCALGIISRGTVKMIDIKAGQKITRTLGQLMA